MFLSHEDLIALTGYKKPALQRRWLVDNRYSFDVRADGRPVVTVEQVNIRQLKGLARKDRATPDFAVLDA